MDTKIEAVDCPKCGNGMVMSVSTDLEEYEQETWKFHVVCTSQGDLCNTCMECIQTGVNDVIHACQVFNNATGKRIELTIEVPNEVVDE